MKNNSVYVGVLIVILVVVGIFAWKSYFSVENKNTWVCTNGQWEPSGNPQTPMPTTTCAVSIQQSTSTQSVSSGIVSLVLQPKQCSTEPWQTWYKEGNIKFIQAPTDEQLIKAYYAQQYGITILSAHRSDTGGATCQACNVCSKGYVFTIEVNTGDVEKLASLGWVNVGEKQ